MRPIPEKFRSGGFEFTLVKREWRIALFAKTNGGPMHYEVIMLRVLPETKFPGGKISPAREAMPPDEAWGTEAWSPHNLQAAEERFRWLKDREKGSGEKGKGEGNKGEGDSVNDNVQFLHHVGTIPQC